MKRLQEAFQAELKKQGARTPADVIRIAEEHPELVPGGKAAVDALKRPGSAQALVQSLTLAPLNPTPKPQ